MSQVTSSIDIAAPPAVVRAKFLDFASLPQYHTAFFTSVTPLGALEPGQKIRVVFAAGQSMNAVIESNSPTVFTWTGRLPLVFTGTHSFTFAPSPTLPNGTLFTQHEDFSGALAFLMGGGVVGRWVGFAEKTRKGWEGFNEDLKRASCVFSAPSSSSSSTESSHMAAMNPPRLQPPKASALFSTYDLQIYKQWQHPGFETGVLADESVLLPTAFEYADFLEWRGKKSAAYVYGHLPVDDGVAPRQDFAGFAQAYRCGHPLHPGHPLLESQEEEKRDVEEEKGQMCDEEKEEDDDINNTIPWCHNCTLRIHLKLLAELWERWHEVGGPWRTLPAGTSGEAFQKAKRAYYKCKVDLINEVNSLEDFARLEAVWERKHPAANMEAVKEWSATEAMKIYEKNVRFPARLADLDDVAPRTPRRTEQRKQLSYSPDTPEDTRHRPNGLFARHVTSYDPESPHRCPDEEGWVETSFKNDWEYNIRQCRLLFCDRNPALPDVTYRKLTDDSSKDRLIRALTEWLAIMPEDWKQSWESMLSSSTEMFLVWKDQQHLGGNENEFNSWDKKWTLVGSSLEAFARRIGDVEDEEEEEGEEEGEEEKTFSQAHLGSVSELVQDEAESGDLLDQDSTASESDENENKDEDIRW
ncbi:sec63-like protein [Stemphylium lycopersici]|nr:sec63-like protein [Stemphylium lycopersici]